MFRARLHPKHSIGDLSTAQRQALHQAILETVDEIIQKDGRYDEYDLYGNKGKYIRLMDKNAVGHPCPECGDEIEKMQYLGGACYLCPSCQK
jgi:formamidopyrimidine-DNA glycosylase